jgi:hypothetical protein
MSEQGKLTVRMLERSGRSSKECEDVLAQLSIPPSGCTARTIARELDLPLEEIGGVLLNHQIYSLEHQIEPGDEVAFVPVGGGVATAFATTGRAPCISSR